jgi:regulator of cell morphogenesis and NO signaling
MTHPAAPVLDPPVQSAMSSADLIAHILERYHAVHLAELGDLIPLARKVEAVHAGHPAAPAGLADHLSFILDDLCGHQRKEEQVLFPMMLDGSHPMIAHPIARMIAEHQDVEEQPHRRLRLLARPDRGLPQAERRPSRAHAAGKPRPLPAVRLTRD